MLKIPPSASFSVRWAPGEFGVYSKYFSWLDSGPSKESYQIVAGLPSWGCFPAGTTLSTRGTSWVVSNAQTSRWIMVEPPP